MRSIHREEKKGRWNFARIARLNRNDRYGELHVFRPCIYIELQQMMEVGILKELLEEKRYGEAWNEIDKLIYKRAEENLGH